ncbi:MAG: maleylpyruvate isomerase family mycothiol-dependent enzyme [Actinomycetota bacterium]
MPLRPAARVDVLDLLVQERAEFVGLLRSLDDEAAATATACEGWTVKDLSGHLLGGDLFFLARNRDGFEGPDPVSWPGDWAAFVAQLDDHNERWVTTGRSFSLTLLCELLEFTGGLTSDFYAAVAPDAPGEVVSWVGPDPAPWWLVAARDFTERWIHHQQIRDALERPGLNGPSFVRPVLAAMMHGVPPSYAGIEAEEGTTVAIDVSGRAGFSWAVRRDSETWNLYEGMSRDAAARVTLDQESAWRFLSRNLSAAAARKAAELEGPKKLTAPFFEAVAVIVNR